MKPGAKGNPCACKSSGSIAQLICSSDRALCAPVKPARTFKWSGNREEDPQITQITPIRKLRELTKCPLIRREDHPSRLLISRMIPRLRNLCNLRIVFKNDQANYSCGSESC